MRPHSSSAENCDSVIALLGLAEGRDQVVECLLGWLAGQFRRVFLFVHTRDELQGRDARGEDVLLENVKQVRISTKLNSCFAEVASLGKTYTGNLTSHNPVEQAFAQALDPEKAPGSTSVVVAAVPVHSRVPLLIVGEFSPSSGAFEGRIDKVCKLAGAALERIILQRKQVGK